MLEFFLHSHFFFNDAIHMGFFFLNNLHPLDLLCCKSSCFISQIHLAKSPLVSVGALGRVLGRQSRRPMRFLAAWRSRPPYRDTSVACIPTGPSIVEDTLVEVSRKHNLLEGKKPFVVFSDISMSNISYTLLSCS